MIVRTSFTAAFVTLAACGQHQPEPPKPVSIELATFEVTAPAGWPEDADPAVQRAAGPESHTLVREHAATQYAHPNIVVRDLTAAGHVDQIQHASLELCKQLQLATVHQTGATPGRVVLASFGAFTGCDAELDDPKGAQGTRQIAVSDGRVLVSVVCNRDKAGDPDAEAACESVVRSIRDKAR